MVAKVAILDRLNAGQDRGFGVLVTQPFELLVEEFGVKDFHTFSVSYKRQGGKLEREEGCIPDLGWMLSEAGFAGFELWQDRGFGVLVTQLFELLVEEFGVKDFHTFCLL